MRFTRTDTTWLPECPRADSRHHMRAVLPTGCYYFVATQVTGSSDPSRDREGAFSSCHDRRQASTPLRSRFGKPVIRCVTKHKPLLRHFPGERERIHAPARGARKDSRSSDISDGASKDSRSGHAVGEGVAFQPVAVGSQSCCSRTNSHPSTV